MGQSKNALGPVCVGQHPDDGPANSRSTRCPRQDAADRWRSTPRDERRCAVCAQRSTTAAYDRCWSTDRSKGIRMKATWNGALIAESDDTVVVEGNHYFPEASLKREYVTFSNHRSSCPWKGQAHYYSLMVDGDLNENAVWYYPEPSEAAQQIKGRVAFWKGVKVS
jgi:uncharacterized protein (DUF427 family)